MKLQKLAGATSNIFQIFIADSSSSTGAGLTGLTNATGGLTAYYHRDTDTTATAISLVTMTVGAFTSSGFKEIDSTNMPGWYQFCPPNTALAAGAKSVAFHLKGATNMLPLPIEVQLTGTDVDNATTFGLTNLDATVSSRLAPTVAARTLDVSATGEAGLDFDNIKDATGAHTLTNITVPVVTAVTGLTASNLDVAVSTRLAPTTAGRTLDVAATGEAGLDFDNIKDATGAHTLTNITVPVVSAVTGLTASNLDTTVSSRLASGSYTAPPSAATIAQAVWDSLTSALTTVNSIGAYLLAKIDVVLSTRAVASTALTNATWTDARAAKLDNLDTTISSRLPTSSYTAPDNADIATILTRTDVATSTRLAASSYTAPDNTTIGTINTKLGTPVSSVSADIASVKTDVDTIPTNPLLTNDSRLDNLDAPVSEVATQLSVDAIRTITRTIEGLVG